MFPYAAWKGELWKTAARAGLRQIARMVQQGNTAGASTLAKTPGVLKPSVAGSQIRHLGQGSEGLATLTASPQHGVAVRKLYDPRGISGPEMIARKEQAGRALGDNPHFAKFLGSAETPHGGQMHFSEYVPTGQAPTGQAGAQSVRHTSVQAQKALTQAGFSGGKDIRRGNMVFDAGTNTHKVIDYIPAQKNEFMRMPRRMENVIATTPETTSPWNPNYAGESTNSGGGMVRRLIGGQSQPGLRRTHPSPVSGTADTVPAPANASAATMPQGYPAARNARPWPEGFAAVDRQAKNQLGTTPLRPAAPTSAATSVGRKPRPINPI